MLKEGIVLEENDEKHAMMISDFKTLTSDIKSGHAAAIQLGQDGKPFAIDMGNFSELMASSVYEEDQSDTPTLEVQGADHVVKYESIYRLLNSEPSINQALNLKSELPVAYGYFFRYPPEFKRQSKKLKRLDAQAWTYWAGYVNFDHVLRQAIHSLYATGNTWIEKQYDTSGLNKGGWGVKRLRVLSPDMMYNVIDSKGKILKFFQWAGGSDRKFANKELDKNLKKSRIITAKEFNDAIKDEKGFKDDIVVFERYQIIYCNYNAYYDDSIYGFGSVVPLLPYARSKIGIQKRILRMIENSASSFVVFKYGTEQFMVSGSVAKKVMSQIGKKKNPKFMVLPFYFDVEVVEMGKSMQNIEPYLEFFRKEQMYGVGLPLAITMDGGSDAGAEVQLEIMVRQMRYMQNFLSNVFKKYLFPEVQFGESWVLDDIAKAKIDPSFSFEYPNISLSRWATIPELKWRTIESVSDQRLRHGVYGDLGTLGESEIREEVGYYGKVDEGDLVRSFKIKQEEMKMAEAMAREDREQAKEIADNSLEVSKVAAKNPAPTGGSKK